MAVWIGVHGARPERVGGERHGVVIGVVIGRPCPPGPGMDAVGNRSPDVMAERWYQARRPARRCAHWIGNRCGPHPWVARRGNRRRGGSGLLLLNVPPGIALRRLAAAAARALRVPERKPHLESEIGAQEIGEVGAVRANENA